MEATLDEFQRHMQALLLDLDHIVDVEERQRVTSRLEAALQEVIHFRTAVALRDEVGEHLFELIDQDLKGDNEAEDDSGTSRIEGQCTKCNAVLIDDIQFCPSCGENR